jgi:hypothetical protein
VDLVATGLGFLLGIIGAGFGFVLDQVIGRHFREDGLKKALAAEIDENVERLGSDTVGPELVSRSAWEQARGLRWTREELKILTAAYAEGERVNAWVTMTNAHLASPGRDAQSQEMFSTFALKTAEGARRKFAGARKLFPA